MRTGFNFRIALIIGLSATVLLPFLPLFLSVFSAGWQWPEMIPHRWGTRGWEYIFSPSARTWEAVQNSLVIAFMVTAISLVVSVPAGSALGRMPFKGKRLVEGLLYAPIIVPPFVAIMGMHMSFIRWGMTETLTGVAMIHLVPTLPYMVKALSISYSTLSPEWEEQACTLGAGRWQRFCHVVLPHLLPGIVAGSSLTILISLSQYLLTLLVGGGQVLTLMLALFPFISGGDPTVGAAYTILFAGVALLLMGFMDGFLRRYFDRKITIL